MMCRAMNCHGGYKTMTILRANEKTEITVIWLVDIRGTA